MNYFSGLDSINPYFLFAIMIWSTFWKLLALWRTAKNDQQYWFIAMFLLNTLGILEIIYLLRFSKTKISVNDLKNANFLPKSKNS
jgi:hypothetical protein